MYIFFSLKSRKNKNVLKHVAMQLWSAMVILALVPSYLPSQHGVKPISNSNMANMTAISKQQLNRYGGVLIFLAKNTEFAALFASLYIYNHAVLPPGTEDR